ncbi:MAG: DUF2911 domain-containing protein [Bacteroidia bacterium]|nr:DUF2911 domain-containing protein [Bacteroidia bacterium]
MKKFVIRGLIVLAVIVLVLFVGFQILKNQTKKHSPEATVEYADGDTKVSVFYCRPYKKERVIFGELVPYQEVWRTGANEATTFSTNRDLKFGGNTLPAGKYTLWTIPDKDDWTVIFNRKQYPWGVNFSQKATREPEADVLQIKVPSEKRDEVVEQFTISFTTGANPTMDLAWDQTKVSVPFE